MNLGEINVVKRMKSSSPEVTPVTKTAQSLTKLDVGTEEQEQPHNETDTSNNQPLNVPETWLVSPRQALTTVVGSERAKAFRSSIILSDMELKEIEYHEAFMFTPTKLGFITGVTKYHNKMNNQDQSSYFLLRGPAVAILIVVRSPNNDYRKLLVVRQLRAPVGRVITEAVAGMVENGDTFKSACVRELHEEAGLKIDVEKLVKLGEFYTSPGVLDEIITGYYIEIDMTEDQIRNIYVREHGNKAEGEAIRLALINDDIIEVADTMDCKLMWCYAMYSDYKFRETTIRETAKFMKRRHQNQI
jgi:8-oxo-dGTP pyrophosphatase MutT (NUDIX family)